MDCYFAIFTVDFTTDAVPCMKPATIFWGEGKEQILGGSCLRYYAYRKMIVAKMVYVRLEGKAQIWEQLLSVPDGCVPVQYIVKCLTLMSVRFIVLHLLYWYRNQLWGRNMQLVMKIYSVIVRTSLPAFLPHVHHSFPLVQQRPPMNACSRPVMILTVIITLVINNLLTAELPLSMYGHYKVVLWFKKKFSPK